MAQRVQREAEVSSVIPDWQAWGSLALVALAIAATLVTARRFDGSLPHYPHHLAAAVMIGMFVWDWALSVPDAIITFANLTAGIDPFAGRDALALFTLAQVAALALAVGAVVSLLRARPWGVALGIGVSVLQLGAGLVLLPTFLAIPGAVESGVGGVLLAVAGRTVPAVVTLALLLWPLAVSIEPAAPEAPARGVLPPA